MRDCCAVIALVNLANREQTPLLRALERFEENYYKPQTPANADFQIVFLKIGDTDALITAIFPAESIADFNRWLPTKKMFLRVFPKFLSEYRDEIKGFYQLEKHALPGDLLR